MNKLKHLNLGDDLIALLTAITFNNKFILLSKNKIDENYIRDFSSILSLNKIRYHDFAHRTARFDCLSKNVVYDLNCDLLDSRVSFVNNLDINKGEYNKYSKCFLVSLIKNRQFISRDIENITSFNFIIKLPSINDYSDDLLKDILNSDDTNKEEKANLKIIYFDSKNHLYDIIERYKERIEDFIIKYCKDHKFDIYRMKVLYQSLLELITVNETLKINGFSYYNEAKLLDIFYRNTNICNLID